MTKPGFKCNFTGMCIDSVGFQRLADDPATNPYTNTSICTPCFFPHHCLANNSCLEGTTGPTCEVCEKSDQGPVYQMIGNDCILCDSIPESAIALVIFIVMLIICNLFKGLSASKTTKLKILVNFVQLSYLSFFMKIHWPQELQRLAGIMSFSTLTADTALLGCYMKDLKILNYLRWLTAIFIPILVYLFAGVFDHIISKKIRRASKEYIIVTLCRHRSNVRHFTYFMLAAYYMAVTYSAVQSFSCTGTFGTDFVIQTGQDQENVFLYDNLFLCDGFIYQTLNFILTVSVVMYTIALPFLLLFFTLRQRKWLLLECETSRFGFLYDSYTSRFCFWEALIMMRKSGSIGVTNTLITDPFTQAVILVSITGVYLLLLLIGRPYRTFYWTNPYININFILEVVCTLAVLGIQITGLLLTLDQYPPVLGHVVFAVVAVALLIWLLFVILSKWEVTDSTDTQMSYNINTSEVKLQQSITRIKKNQIGEYVTKKETKRRMEQTDF